MDLLSVLKSNGTGLLEGLCRLHNRDGISFFNLTSSNKMVKIDFSIGAENLGTYKVRIDSIEESGNINCTIMETEDIGMGVLLRIKIEDVGDFGRFQAFDYR
jgi:hypothetical protein